MALRRLVNGYQVTQAIHVAATLGIADLLADGPRASAELDAPEPVGGWAAYVGRQSDFAAWSSLLHLHACREAVPPQGALVILERDLGVANENPDAKFSDLNMMVGPGGRERTRDEFAALLAAGGFTLERTVPSAIALTVFEGRPA